MSAKQSIVVEAVLKPDGTLEFEHPPTLPPGRVRVRMEMLDDPFGPSPIVIEEPMLEPWVELPQPSGIRVRTKLGKLPLPDPPEIPDDGEA